MSRLLFVRHGQASFGADDYDRLSVLGEQQATELGNYFKRHHLKPGKVVSGTMERHIATQTLCCESLTASNLEIARSPGWNEFAHQEVLAAHNPEFASPAGMKSFLARQQHPETSFIREFSLAMARWQSGEYRDYPESWVAFKTRVTGELKLLSEQASETGDVVIFTSGGVISLVIMALWNIPDSEFFNINKNLYNCSVTWVKKGRSRLSLQSVNDTGAFIDNPDWLSQR